MWPPGAQWDLRISVAEIARDGPFSDYTGFDRWFAVLHGAGVALQLGSDRWQLRRGGAPLRFDGALAPMCWLLDGATSDLNLLVRRDAGRGSMTRAHAGARLGVADCLARAVHHACAGPSGRRRHAAQPSPARR